MACILPGYDELLDLLNRWDTPAFTPENSCPKCGGPVIFDNLYCGGRGYKTYRVCNSGECDFMKREG